MQVAARIGKVLRALKMPEWMNPPSPQAWAAPTPKVESTSIEKPELDQTPIMVGLGMPTATDPKFNLSKPQRVEDLESKALSQAASIPKRTTLASDMGKKLASKKSATSKPLIRKRNRNFRPKQSPLQMLHNPQMPSNEKMDVDFESIGIGELAALDAEEAANTEASFAEMQTAIQEMHTNAINMLIQRLRVVEAHLDRMEIQRVF
jgi:hypothetical protein